MEIEVGKKEITVVNKGVRTDNIKEVKTQNSKKMEREVSKEDIVDTLSAGFGASKPEMGPEVEVLRSAVRS